MEIIAAGSFRWYLNQFSGAIGPAHPVGSPFYNIEGARRDEVGVYRLFFSVDTPRTNLRRYLWLVQSVWEFHFIHEIEWIKPRECIVRFKNVNTGELADPLEWNLLVGKRDGSMAEPMGLVVLQSFNPDGSLAGIDNHPLKEFGARGVSKPAAILSPGAYYVETDVDISTGGSAWYLWCEDKEFSAVRYSTDMRHARVDTGIIATETSPALTSQPWHLAIFNYSDAKPTSISLSVPGNQISLGAGAQSLILEADFPLGNPLPNSNYLPGVAGVQNTPGTYGNKLWKGTSSDPAVMSFPDPYYGAVFPQAEGTATITVEFRGLVYTTPTITVVP